MAGEGVRATTEHCVLHCPSCKLETAEIPLTPQGMALKCLSWGRCLSLAGGVTKLGMHHFPWSLLTIMEWIAWEGT